MRTLVLLLELLAAVVAFQYLVTAKLAKADAIWLAGDCITMTQAPAGQSDDTTAP